MPRLLIAAAALWLAVLPARAEAAELSPELAALIEALGLPDVVEIMREEGIGYGTSVEDEMFPGRGGPAWAAVVEGIYDAGAMRDTIEQGLAETLDPEVIDPLLQFFASDRGERIVSFEVSARQALMDEDIEAAARATYGELRRAGDPRLALIDDYVEVNDLIESNVMGAMNSSFAFYAGLIDGGALDGDMTERQALSLVWAQEPEIRAETEEWVFSYLALAYRPLDDSDLEAYVALSESPEGQALNSALFAAFDEMFTGISRALGLAAAQFMIGEDI